MNGFVSAYQRQARNGTTVMGYYDRRQLPFYWNAAGNYVLFDHFFSSTRYGIRANRSYWVSAATAPGGRGGVPDKGYGKQPTIFDRLQAAGVSWKFYVQGYDPARPTGPPPRPIRKRRPPGCRCSITRASSRTPRWPSTSSNLDQYARDLADGTLPAVSYMASSSGDNERSARSIVAGQDLVRDLVTQLMQSRYWDSSALMWSYDSSGGWFDHVTPPRVGRAATLGFRVPALLVSSYARKGQVNHTVLDYTSALKFIESNWGLAPLTARDAHANSLASAFDFAAGPRPPILIPSGRSALPAGTVPDAYLPPPTPVAAIYWLYGGTAVIGVVLLLFAAWWPALSARRRGRAAARLTQPDGASS